MMHLRCYCTFSNSCPNLQQQQQGHLVSPRRRQLDVNKRRTTIYKGARRPATADVPKLSTTEHFHDTQPLIFPKERPSLFRSPSERQSAKIKHSLERSLSLDNKKVTRSKVTDDFEHTELTFGRKPRVKKMVTIKLEEAFKLIPMCTGEDDIYPFINACDMAVNLVEEKCAPTLVKYITTRLSGRALEMIKYKNVTKWAYIKIYLMDAFEDTTTASSLQIQLNSIKMRHGEDVNDYCHRVEKLYYKLCTACTLNKEESEAKIIHETLKEQTLTIFIKGLISPIKIIVKARNPKTLEVAKQLAKAEEFEKLSNREIIFEVDIGKFDKTGRLLNLVETHDRVCNRKHKTTYAHDPRLDVEYTKCIFNHVLQKQRHKPFFLWGGVMGYSALMMHLRCYCTFSNSCPNLQQQRQGHLVSPRRRQLDVNKRRTTIYKGARRPATADVPKLSTTEHFHDTQPLILFVTCI
ncbi:hypothetical protein AGLY_015598 [Aphis glycines]|uniref:Retrotransposon gag domain-containing protein n=1 Tax=Aphis glycines TaxID=307491 RepID=A0A6G0T203_APHGL|nr:hypothetical protein AGLY_015598 [Aphis glycines]